ncbi:MAG: GNAT family N-acetyltransferase [Microbacterium sp.]
MATTRVVRNDDERRYEIFLIDDATGSETLAGFARFTLGTNKTRFVHTETDPAFKGRGLGSALAAEALADVVSRGDTIMPLCPFIEKYLRENDVPGAVVEWPTRD